MNAMAPDTRMIECPECGGEGGHHTLTSYDPRNGEPTGYWTTCSVCEGNREVEIAVEPITLEDLEYFDEGDPSRDPCNWPENIR
jgi:hypothetical protein